MIDPVHAFAGLALDRRAEEREDAAWALAQAADPRGRYLLLREDARDGFRALVGAAPLVFTGAAAQKVRELIAEEGNPDLKLRVYISGGGCSGFQYGFSFDEERAEDDLAVQKDGVTLVVDPLSLQYLAGAEIDYSESLSGAQFVIRNPNARTTCGCGSSFTV